MNTELRRSATVHRFNTIHRYSRTPPPLVPCNPAEEVPFDLDQLDDDRYRLTLQAAGYRPDDIDATISGGVLRISGKRSPSVPNGTRLHQGLAGVLECRFVMLEPMSITGVTLADGLLAIELEIDPLDPCMATRPMRSFDQAMTEAVAA